MQPLKPGKDTYAILRYPKSKTIFSLISRYRYIDILPSSIVSTNRLVDLINRSVNKFRVMQKNHFNSCVYQRCALTFLGNKSFSMKTASDMTNGLKKSKLTKTKTTD